MVLDAKSPKSANLNLCHPWMLPVWGRLYYPNSMKKVKQTYFSIFFTVHPELWFHKMLVTL